MENEVLENVQSDAEVFPELPGREENAQEKPRRPRRPRTGMVQARTPGAIISDIVLIVLVVGAAAICILPMWHVLMLSLSDGFTAYNFEGVALIPQGAFTFKGDKELFAYGAGLIWTGYLNQVF